MLKPRIALFVYLAILAVGNVAPAMIRLLRTKFPD